MAVTIDMSGTTAIVTGAAQGIGFETASYIAQAGGSVMVADRNGEAAEQAAAQLAEEGHDAAAVAVDIRDAEQARAAVAATVERFGGVDVLVNNAAVWTVDWFKNLTPDHYDKDIGVTLVGTMNMCRAALDPMVAGGKGGAVVNLISDSGRVGEPRLTAYSAAKAGVVGFTKAFAKESARYGIRANGVSPGTTHTPGGDAVLETWGGADKVTPFYPLGRLGEPSDIAYAILFLCSPLSTWVTGQVLSVNGGYAMPD
jgi:NAD(P)-dependent dehydrogenase (short-subunit alcohol dehydrogenase family)